MTEAMRCPRGKKLFLYYKVYTNRHQSILQSKIAATSLYCIMLYIVNNSHHQSKFTHLCIL